ncbi:uncharacterized protein LOC117521022 isoform X2 [Thalassophryne amazonica]|uniref:uncharacterized protein LOC117521022 isoform X2 n=1 Tax=Thalassophryne amazonica TaxID=390379 RepID=UPI00147202B1|nr:uncharacterized protein LOC117521022 isoform X2 [Thalassophryne amazonica]
MFARPAAMSHLRGSDCIRCFAKACGAKCLKALSSTKLRKHAATLSTVLNMSDTGMDQLANFLGHDIRIHHEFYRLPDKTLQLAKISKVLLALESGRLAEFHGKNLDQITIDPNESVRSDDEDGCRHDHLFAVDDAVGTESSTDKQHKGPLAEHGASSGVSPVAHSYKDVGIKKSSTNKQQKWPLAEHGASSRVSPVAQSSKGRAAQKRTPWQAAEVRAVERQMSQFIRSCTVPSKRDCEKCLRAEPEALCNRTWQNLNFFVHNWIVALKKKMEAK